jgi:hypothetical protein
MVLSPRPAPMEEEQTTFKLLVVATRPVLTHLHNYHRPLASIAQCLTRSSAGYNLQTKTPIRRCTMFSSGEDSMLSTDMQEFLGPNVPVGGYRLPKISSTVTTKSSRQPTSPMEQENLPLKSQPRPLRQAPPRNVPRPARHQRDLPRRHRPNHPQHPQQAPPRDRSPHRTPQRRHRSTALDLRRRAFMFIRFDNGEWSAEIRGTAKIQCGMNLRYISSS